MRGINEVTALGNLGDDPELKQGNGFTLCRFSIACSESFVKKGETEPTQKTEWIRCVAWGKTADNIKRFFAKGDPIWVRGKLETSSWEDKDSGQKRYKTEVNVNDFRILLTKEQREKFSSNSGGGYAPPPSQSISGGGYAGSSPASQNPQGEEEDLFDY